MPSKTVSSDLPDAEFITFFRKEEAERPPLFPNALPGRNLLPKRQVPDFLF